ncbi:MAG: hypothetical protein KKG78_17415, partial [Alphaproteobacteria bacterium]|nr:hypothetical protein [Alphaproteobacteria bacterium]
LGFAGGQNNHLPKGDYLMSGNIFQNAFDRLVSARERQVRRYVNGALLAMDDAQLKSIGRTREELQREGAQAYFF